jgi:hypothetical protein
MGEMSGLVDHLDSKNLIPFKKRRNGYHLPGLTKEVEEQVIDEVDPELRPEEQGYVRHYLGYADVMLKSAEAEQEQEEAAEEGGRQQTQARGAEHTNLTEMPKRRQESKGHQEDDDGENGDSNAA